MNRENVGRFVKYMAGGGLYFWVGYAVFALCYSGFKWSWLPSKIVADAIGWTLNYLVQRFWAFSDRANLGEMQHAGRYVFIESIGFVLDYIIIGALNAIGITPYIGFFISAAFFTVWSWLWYKYWVFPEGSLLYHASPQAGLKYLEPQRTLSNDKYIGDYVFATEDKTLAAMYLATKGVPILMHSKGRHPWIAIRADEKNYISRDKGGTIYQLAEKDFEETPQSALSDFEKVSKSKVKPLSMKVYNSSIKAMRGVGAEIYFVDQNTYDELVAAKNEQALIDCLKPYVDSSS